MDTPNFRNRPLHQKEGKTTRNDTTDETTMHRNNCCDWCRLHVVVKVYDGQLSSECERCRDWLRVCCVLGADAAKRRRRSVSTGRRLLLWRRRLNHLLIGCKHHNQPINMRLSTQA